MKGTRQFLLLDRAREGSRRNLILVTLVSEFLYPVALIVKIEDEEQTDASTIRSLTASTRTAPSEYRSRSTVTKSSDLEITQIDDRPPSYSHSRASYPASGSFKKSSDLDITTFDEGIPDIPLVATNSTQLLVQNIASIK